MAVASASDEENAKKINRYEIEIEAQKTRLEVCSRLLLLKWNF